MKYQSQLFLHFLAKQTQNSNPSLYHMWINSAAINHSCIFCPYKYITNQIYKKLNTKKDKLNLKISDTKNNPVTNQIYQNWTQIEQAHTSKYGSKSIQLDPNKLKPISIQLGSSLPKEKKKFFFYLYLGISTNGFPLTYLSLKPFVIASALVVLKKCYFNTSKNHFIHFNTLFYNSPTSNILFFHITHLSIYYIL